MKPNPSSKYHYIVSFSGGKDSVALWLHLTRDLKLKNVTAIHCLTGHEDKLTNEYIELLQRDYGLDLIMIQGSEKGVRKKSPHKRLTMEGLAVIKKRFPSTMARFCTTELKLKPCRSFLFDIRKQEVKDAYFTDRLPELKGEICLTTGIRAQESKRRQNTPSMLFDDWMDCQRWHPIKDWTAVEVFAIHEKYNIPPNPLYKMGASRVGCNPCIMSNKHELTCAAIMRPHVFEELGEMEKRVNSIFFAPDTTPLRYRSKLDEKSGKKIATAEDVRRWALNKMPAELDAKQLKLFDDDSFDSEAPVCSSVYGLCE